MSRGLTYIALDLPTAKLFVFVDGSFINNHDLSSQIGYVIMLTNKTIREQDFSLSDNIIYQSSTKYKRVTRSVLTLELYAMAAGVNITISISTTLAMVTQRLKIEGIPTVVYTDSLSLYKCIVKLRTTKEKRLMIDIMAIRQSYEHRELSKVRQIKGISNPTDTMTKAILNKALRALVNTNSLTIQV